MTPTLVGVSSTIKTDLFEVRAFELGTGVQAPDSLLEEPDFASIRFRDSDIPKLATAYSGSAAWIASTTVTSECERDIKRLVDILTGFDGGFDVRGMFCQRRDT